MFFKGSANKGIRLKTRVRMASPAPHCHLRPEAHREVFQVYVSCIERYKPLDLFSVPFFTLSVRLYPKAGDGKAEGRRQE